MTGQSEVFKEASIFLQFFLIFFLNPGLERSGSHKVNWVQNRGAQSAVKTYQHFELAEYAPQKYRDSPISSR